MEPREYIESGQLELYVYGLLDPTENTEISRLAEKNKEIDDEIRAIEEAVVSLSSSFSPEISPELYIEICNRLELRKLRETETIRPISDDTEERPVRNIFAFIGWAAAVVFLLGAGYLFYQLQESQQSTLVLEDENAKGKTLIEQLEQQQKQSAVALKLIRDPKNTVVTLSAQPISPESSARIYWNKETQAVVIDGSSLPPAPEGKVYQAWAIYNKPFNAVSIGVMENATAENIYALHSTADADAFGVTLEPAGGSETPTLEQLYVMGAVSKG